MTFYDLVTDFIKDNKKLFAGYVTICCVVYMSKVLLTSYTYSKMFNKNADFKETVKQICMVWAFLCILYIVKSRLETVIVPEFLSYIRKKLFANYIRNNEQNFNDTDVTSDLNNILEVSRNIRDIFQWVFGTFIPTVSLMISINMFFMYKFPKIGMIMVAGNLLNFHIIKSYAPPLIKSSNKRENEFLKMVGKLDENFNNMMNIFLNDKAEETIKDNYQLETQYTEIYRVQNKELEGFASKLKASNYTFALISMIALYKTTSNPEDFINGLLIFTFYLSTLENMAEDIPFSIMTLGNIQFLEETLGKKNPNHIKSSPVYQTRPTSKSLANYKGSVTFKDIYFRYSEHTPYILENLSLDIPSGDKIAIVAQSGSGKSTSMKLLLGFYQPEKGDILLDGESITNFNVNDIRSKINYINQKTLLFNDTVMNNLKYGNNKTDQEIFEFLKKYDLLKILCKDNNNCLDKIVDKNGTNISMGMQKIIFLVRGILKNNVAVYVFDEPLTSVDPSTRSNILDMIKNETKGKTVIIITHDSEVSKIVNRTVYLAKQQASK
jgi:ABC-type multidrug transport system fused ATPase/permease subunit